MIGNWENGDFRNKSIHPFHPKTELEQANVKLSQAMIWSIPNIL